MNSLPLYQQEKDWEQLGITLSRVTMANWIIRCAQNYLVPATGYLRKEDEIKELQEQNKVLNAQIAYLSVMSGIEMEA